MDHLLPDTFDQAVLQGFAVLRPALVADLPDLAGVPADRLAAALSGHRELTDDEIDRIAHVADLSPSELAVAVTGVGDGELGSLFARVVASDAACFRAAKGTGTPDPAPVAGLGEGRSAG